MNNEKQGIPEPSGQGEALLTKEQLIGGAPRLGEEDVRIPGLGKVRVRGLSRAQVLEIQEHGSDATQERKSVAASMVSPKLTENEVGQWQALAASGEFDELSATVLRLSGQVPESAKEAYKSVSE